MTPELIAFGSALVALAFVLAVMAIQLKRACCDYVSRTVSALLDGIAVDLR